MAKWEKFHLRCETQRVETWWWAGTRVAPAWLVHRRQENNFSNFHFSIVDNCERSGGNPAAKTSSTAFQPQYERITSSLEMTRQSPSDTPLDSVSSSFPQNYFHIFPPFSLADKLGKTVERVPGAVGVHQYPMFTSLPRPHNTSLQTNKTSTTSTINNPLTNS